MVKRIRNKSYMPYVSTEGVLAKPFPPVRTPSQKGVNWYSGLTSFERMFAHQTLASVRRYAYFKPFRYII